MVRFSLEASGLDLLEVIMAEEQREALAVFLTDLIGGLLGFDYGTGRKYRTVSYWQTASQHYAEVVVATGEAMQAAR